MTAAPGAPEGEGRPTLPEILAGAEQRRAERGPASPDSMEAIAARLTAPSPDASESVRSSADDHPVRRELREVVARALRPFAQMTPKEGPAPSTWCYVVADAVLAALPAAPGIEGPGEGREDELRADVVRAIFDDPRWFWFGHHFWTAYAEHAAALSPRPQSEANDASSLPGEPDATP